MSPLILISELNKKDVLIVYFDFIVIRTQQYSPGWPQTQTQSSSCTRTTDIHQHSRSVNLVLHTWRLELTEVK